ncbi:DYW domain containing protein [Trema orientale]|uniref:DYW domain containing protein n=1 Tax=Trema orientale TaxID=63057 RepID=A0A2P5F6B6_TREOI|nr:DYW domain containing protein [Trema orientale]
MAVSSHASFTTSLINCYLSCKDLDSARKLFENYPSSRPPTLVWNFMVRAYSKINNSRESIFLFSQMLASSSLPDKYTFTYVITSCSHQISLHHGEIIHGLAVKNGFDSDLFVGNVVIYMYGVFARMEDARKTFDEMPERDVFTWTGLLRGYAKGGEVGKACELFGEMPMRNEVSWTVMISGFIGCERYIEALKYFHDMLYEGKVKPNEATLVSILSACAHLGALDQGKWIHEYIDVIGFPFSNNILTALIDMYAKCGRIDRAKQVFIGISKRDVFNYTAMITGLSIHGLGKDAIQVFSQMLMENVMPNDITLLGLLKGCSHSGLVQEGSSIFFSMENSWGVVPRIEHYGCYVDLLGRAGYLERAFVLVKSMPIRPDIVIWMALLSACRVHRDSKLGEQIVRHIELLDDSGNSAGKVLLSNLNASLGKWERVAELRHLISDKRNKSNPGQSWIEVNGVVHEFRVDDQLHPQIAQIQEKLIEVLKQARLGGYIASTSQVSFDLSEEDKEQAVAYHSEKLAVTFGLMSTEPGTSIRIVKSLRTCDDCHSALKAISTIYKRELIVRDRSRFHTFREGMCSCNDYW